MGEYILSLWEELKNFGVKGIDIGRGEELWLIFEFVILVYKEDLWKR